MRKGWYLFVLVKGTWYLVGLRNLDMTSLLRSGGRRARRQRRAFSLKRFTEFISAVFQGFPMERDARQEDRIGGKTADDDRIRRRDRKKEEKFTTSQKRGVTTTRQC